MFRFIFFIIFKIDFVVKVYGNSTANFDDYMIQDLQEVAYDIDNHKQDIPQNGTKDVSFDMNKDKHDKHVVYFDYIDKDKQDKISQNGTKDVSFDLNKDKHDKQVVYSDYIDKDKQDKIPQNGTKDVSFDLNKDKHDKHVVYFDYIDKDKQDKISQNGTKDVSFDLNKDKHDKHVVYFDYIDKDKQDKISQNGTKDVSFDLNKDKHDKHVVYFDYIDKDKQDKISQNGTKDVSFDLNKDKHDKHVVYFDYIDKDKQDKISQNGTKDVSFDLNKDKHDKHVVYSDYIDKDKQGNIPQNGTKNVDDMNNIPESNATQTNETSKESTETITNATAPAESDDNESYYEVPRDQSHGDEPDFKPYDEIANLTTAEIYSIIIDSKLFNEMIKKQIIFMYGGPHPDKYEYVGNLLWAYLRSKIGEQIVTVTVPTPKNRYARRNVSTLPPLDDYFEYSENSTVVEIQQENQSTTNLSGKQKFSTTKKNRKQKRTTSTTRKSKTEKNRTPKNSTEKTTLKPKTNETQNESTTTNLTKIQYDHKETTEKTELSTTRTSEKQEDSTEETEFPTTLKPDTQGTQDQTITTKLPKILYDQKERTEKNEFPTTQESQLTPTEQNDNNVIRHGMDNPVNPAHYNLDTVTGPGGYLTPKKDNLIKGITTPLLPSTKHPIVKDLKTKNMNLGYRRSRIGDLDNRIFGESYRKKNNGGGGLYKDARRKYDKKGKATTMFNKFSNNKRNKIVIKQSIENFKVMEALKKYKTKIVRTTAKHWSNFYKIHGKVRSFGRTASFYETQLKNNKKTSNLNKKTLKINFDNKKGKMADLNDGILKYNLKTKQKAKIKNIESRKNNIYSGMDIETDRNYRLTSESESVSETKENKMDKHTIRNHLQYKYTKLNKSFKKRHERNKNRRRNVKNKVLLKNLGQKKLSVLKKHQKESSVDNKTQTKENERPSNAYRRQYNDGNPRPSDSRRPYGNKRRPCGVNTRPAGVSRRPPYDITRPSDANQLQSMYLTPRYEYNSRRINENLNLTRRSNAKLISSELSYSYEEYDIKFHLQDAIRHPIDFKSKIQQNSLVFEKVQNVRRQMAPVDRISLREESNYSDDEGIIKNNLYKAFNKKS